VKRITAWVSSDLHNGPVGHPATDATPGWAEAWASIDAPTWAEFWPERHDSVKIRLGDMDELAQFSASEIGELVGTDVAGNHDAKGPCKRWEIKLGDTRFMHGSKPFDPWPLRWLGPPVCRVLRVAEWFWPDVDVTAGAWFQRKFRGGRYGERETYVRKAVAYAKKHGDRQIVFGHLHQRFEEDRDGVHVVCTGCCCNGHMDFVPVTVEV